MSTALSPLSHTTRSAGQCALNAFVIFRPGTNAKSMAFVDNVAEFFLHCTNGPPGVRVFNYFDGPDFGVNALVTLVRQELRGKPSVHLRLPLWLGLALGRVAFVVTKLTGRNLPISWIRVKKFVTTTSFAGFQSEAHGFRPHATLEEGLRITLDAEFKSPDPNRAVFLTE